MFVSGFFVIRWRLATYVGGCHVLHTYVHLFSMGEVRFDVFVRVFPNISTVYFCALWPPCNHHSPWGDTVRSCKDPAPSIFTLVQFKVIHRPLKAISALCVKNTSQVFCPFSLVGAVNCIRSITHIFPALHRQPLESELHLPPALQLFTQVAVRMNKVRSTKSLAHGLYLISVSPLSFFWIIECCWGRALGAQGHKGK